MTTYNGEQFVSEQISSILPQLQPHDELIICDDCSADATLSIIQSFDDPRIKLIQNHTQFGINKNIEQALTLASGDYLFISDQDDIWLPEKVNEILHTFSQNPKTTLVATNSQAIDESGTALGILSSLQMKSGQAPKYQRVTSNLMYNKYRGCTLAIRREALAFTLPIPENVPMYDWWIGLINEMHGKSYFIEKPLVQYRRHEANLTPYSRANKFPLFFEQFGRLVTDRATMLNLLFNS